MERVRGRSVCALPLLTAALVFSALSGNQLAAQGSTAAITGTVRDASGAVLEGTAITVKHVDTGLTRATVSDVGGSYSVPSLPVGAYEVTAERPGFFAPFVEAPFVPCCASPDILYVLFSERTES